MSAESKLAAACTSLIIESPFFGSLALGLPPKPDTRIKTLATNGVVMKYNPAFVESLTHAQLKSCIAHEVMHCALGHPWRRELRDIKGWNFSCDKPINHELREAGFTLPDSVLYATGDEIGKSAEWIYGRIPQAPLQNPQVSPQPQPDDSQNEDESDGQGTGNGEAENEQDDSQSGQDQSGGGESQDGDGDASEGDSEPESTESYGDPLGDVEDAPTEADEDGNPPPTEQEWKERVMVAVTEAELAGKLPGGMKRLIEKAMQPRIDVKSLLLRFFSERSTSDYTWSRPNPRYLAHGLYLPALEANELGEIAVLIDTSGSVSSQALQYARGILEQVLDECNPSGCVLYFVDTEVHGVHRMEKGEPLTWEPKGGGGTSFANFFRAVAAGEIQPVCIIGISDLFADFGDTPPEVPMLWLTDTENGTAPWGEVVYIDR